MPQDKANFGVPATQSKHNTGGDAMRSLRKAMMRSRDHENTRMRSAKGY